MKKPINTTDPHKTTSTRAVRELFQLAVDERAKNPNAAATIARKYFDATHPEQMGRPLSEVEQALRMELGALEAPGSKPTTYLGSQSAYEDFLWRRWQHLVRDAPDQGA